MILELLKIDVNEFDLYNWLGISNWLTSSLKCRREITSIKAERLIGT
jgi:hypothetical protein